MKKIFCLSLCSFLAVACSESDGRLNPNGDAGADSAADRGVPTGNCDPAFPQSAFAPDVLATIDQSPTAILDRNKFLLQTEDARQRNNSPIPAPRLRDEAAPRDRACGHDILGGFAWDGHRCRGVLQSYCSTAGCPSVYASVEDCTSNHSQCEPSLCRTSGGVWSEFDVSCAGFTCGILDIDCRAEPQPQCICPVGQTFGRAGCESDAANCEANKIEIGCRASGGIWAGNGCGDYRCGQPSPLACASGGCDCGPLSIFNRQTLKCEPSASCASHTQSELCEWSGGTWDPSASKYACGVSVFSGRDLPPGGACNCGARSTFDSALGCVLAPQCRTNLCF